jgi:4'-phosphopantetheinyl transferase
VIEPMPAGAAQIWFLEVDADDERTAAAASHVLSAEERTRAARFRFDRDRRLYASSRLLLRTVLSRVAGAVAPADWVFTADRRGRPRIARPADIPLEFSLTHTPGLVCCAISTERFLGVDAEDTRRPTDAVEMARGCLSAGEQSDVTARRGDDRQVRFLEYWTLKESLAKALGVGLSADLSRFSFRLDEPIAVRFGDRPKEDPGWCFRLFRPTPDHTIGVSMRRRGAVTMAMQLHEAVPQELR